LPVGYVAGTNPVPGTVLAPGQTVQVVVVRGPFPVHVPSVVGRKLGDAESQLRSAGFTNITVERRDNDAPRDEVIEQTPQGGAGMVSAEGQAVTLVVSNGPTQPMPNLVGENCQTAVDRLEDLEGMNIHVSTPGVAGPLRTLTTVKVQNVPPDTPLTEGQTVELQCGV
jgi:serine/threonine-protein kinase